MTAFGLLWQFLKTEDPTLRQDDFADEIGLQGINGDRTIRNWIKTGFSPAKVTPYEIYKEVFVTNNKFDMLMAKHFLAYIEDNGYERPPELGENPDTKEFEHFFSVFLMSDKAKNKKAPAPAVQMPKFSMPMHFRERREELDRLLENAFSTPDYRVHAIVGEHGIGKTTFALKYANEAAEEKKFSDIINISYKSSIRGTVANLEKDSSDSASSDRFEKNLLRLCERCSKGEVLLIIDNYENPALNDELAEDNGDYVRLLQTGCRILITSTSDLSKCHAIGDRVTYLSHFDSETLAGLFFDVKGRRDDREDEVKELIEKYLLWNTYLVVLSAELAKQGMSAREIGMAIGSLHADDTDNIAINKDGKRHDEQTLFEHYCRVLENNRIVNPEDVWERREIHGVLGVLALLPIGGVPTSDFEEVACPYSRRKIFKRSVSRLKNHNIVFENGGRIYLQPVVREYIARRILLLGEDTHAYLLALIKKLNPDSYDAAMMYWVNIAEAAEEIIRGEHTAKGARMRMLELDDEGGNETADKVIGTAAILMSRIAACYSSVNMHEKAYEYGVPALEGLRNILQAQTVSFDKLTLATCFNVVGYAFLHGDVRMRERNMMIAFECIKRGEELARRALSEDEDSVRARIVLTKLQGELAAYYLKKGEYLLALENHTLALRERERLIEADPFSIKFRSMLAFTYRGIGTDYFYISRNSDRAENLLLSYENNLRSVKLFEELYGSRRLETVEGYNRLAGTALALISKFGDSLPESLGKSFAGLVDELYNYMEEAFEFYGGCHLALNGEIADSLKRVISLTEMMKSRGAFDPIRAALNEKVIATVHGLESADEKCKALLAELERITENR